MQLNSRKFIDIQTFRLVCGVFYDWTRLVLSGTLYTSLLKKLAELRHHNAMIHSLNRYALLILNRVASLNSQFAPILDFVLLEQRDFEGKRGVRIGILDSIAW